MRIEKNQNLNLFPVLKNNEIKAEGKKEVKNEEFDNYQFNVEAKELNDMFKLASQSIIVREDVLQAFKEKYEAGEYHVTGEDVIKKVMEG